MRTGLFLSRNHGRIAAAVDVDKLAGRYSDPVVVKVYDSFFGPADQHDILKQVDDYKLDAVVLAGNSAVQFQAGRPGAALAAALKGRGVNANKMAVANIDEQVAMVHPGVRDGATEKAGLLIDTALAKVQYCPAIDTVQVAPCRTVLVLGTTVGAVIAAYMLLDQNYAVHIVEKGGAWRADAVKGAKFEAILSRVKAHPAMEFFAESDLTNVSGWCGDYTVELSISSRPVEITVGSILLGLGDDTEWIARLRPKMRLDTDATGLLVNDSDAGFGGRTKHPGILFIPFKPGANQLRSEVQDARAAVGLITAVLERPVIDHPVLVTEVNEALCGGCGTCIKTCAFSASRIDEQKKISALDPKRCAGCGNCVTACPTGARDLSAYPVRYMHCAIDILSQGAVGNGEPRILAILCKNSGDPAADAAGDPANHPAGQTYSPNILPLRIECAGNIDTLYILKAFQKGFDGVALVVCKDGHCHNIVGNTDMERRLGLLRSVLRSRKIDDNRMRIFHITRREGRRLNAELQAFSAELRQLHVK
jgi:F420-non-reducing hydrogenase iron-sulfur subunit